MRTAAARARRAFLPARAAGRRWPATAVAPGVVAASTTFKHCERAGHPTKAAAWLGPLEHRIASYALESGLRLLRLADVARALGADIRAVWWALRRLAERGLARRVARGLYELLEDPARLAALPVRPANENSKEGQGTRGPRSPPPPEGPRFDNVRGLTQSGYVHGDRGRSLSQADLSRFERVSYAEVQYVVRGLGEMPGLLVVYTNLAQDGPNAIRVEWRPPRSYVRENGLASAVRMFWAAVALAQAALLELSLRAGPQDHLRLVLGRLARRALPLLGPRRSRRV